MHDKKGNLMDYREIAKQLLSKKVELKNAYVTLGDELTMLENEKYSVKSCTTDSAVAKGGGSKYEEYMTNLIFLSDNTEFRRKVVKRELDMIESGMAALSDYEKDLLEVFYVKKEKNAPEVIYDRWYKERSQVYADRNAALIKFTRAVYGVIHL